MQKLKIENVYNSVRSFSRKINAAWLFRAAFIYTLGVLAADISFYAADAFFAPKETWAGNEETELAAYDEGAVTEGEDGTGGALYGADDVVIKNASLEAASAAVIAEEYGAASPVFYFNYKVQQGDTISVLAIKFGLNQDTLISFNNIKNSRAMRYGEILKVPNQDGIMHHVDKKDTMSEIAEKYKVSLDNILMANEYFTDKLQDADTLFIPGAKMDRAALQEINGDLFIWPTANRFITSRYGWRRSPISGERLFHTGIDIRGNTGAPVYAAMSGRVTYTGYNAVYGNHIVVSHHSGYRTLYAHLNTIRVKSGVYVSTGSRIGDVGNTGQSTAAHLHFTVYKDGVTVNPQVVVH